MGYDWLWSTYHEICADKLLETFEAAVALQQSIADYVAGARQDRETAGGSAGDAAGKGLGPDEVWQDRLVLLPQWKPWLETLSENVHQHINPPVALASGHSALADKVANGGS